MLPDVLLSEGNSEGLAGTKGWEVPLAPLLGHPTKANPHCSLLNVIVQLSHDKDCQLSRARSGDLNGKSLEELCGEGMGKGHQVTENIQIS